jgi:CBS-domain-containing membrane protein
MRAIDGVRRSGVGVRPQRPIRDAAVIMDQAGVGAADLDARDVVTCTPDTTVRAVAALMMEHYVRHLLVEDRNGPVGMVSARDLLGAYA